MVDLSESYRLARKRAGATSRQAERRSRASRTQRSSSLGFGWMVALLAACGGDRPAPATYSGIQTSDAAGQTLDAASPTLGAEHQPLDAASPTPDAERSTRDAGSQTQDDAGGQSATHASIPCDVQSVISSRCATCHGQPPQFGAPVALASHADFHAQSVRSPSHKRHEVALERVVSDNPANQMPPASQPAMPEAERRLLQTWLENGAPAGDLPCSLEAPSPAPDDSDDTSGLACYKMVAHAVGDRDEPYWVGLALDTYMNFAFRAPWGPDRAGYAVLIRPIIDNTRVLHHWLLFREDLPVVDGDVFDSNATHPTGELVYGWAPGGTNLDFRGRDDVAFEFPKGSSFHIEAHYNSDDPEAQDASGAEVCLREKPPLNVAGISWLGSDVILNTRSVQSTCIPSRPQPIHIVGVSPHMHLQGRHLTATIHRAGGGDETLYDRPFEFNDQAWYSRDLELAPGDSITTRCDYHQPVSFGKETTAEMCYLFVIGYPTGALSDGGLLGTFLHGRGACLGF